MSEESLNRKEMDSMIDFVKKTLLAGIGLTSLTEERIKKLVDTWIKEGEVTEEEGKKLINEMVERGKKSKEELEEKIAKEVSMVLTKMNIATKKEIDELKEKIDTLEKKLDQ